jgi:CSLREA domain-containing protein
VAALLLLAAPAQADITVNTHADVVASDGLCSLREAVAAAADCGSGTIHLPGGAPYLLTTPLSVPGGATVRIEGAGAVLQASGFHRIISVYMGATVRLSGLTIRGGYAPHGGGIENIGNLTLVGVTVTGNRTSPGDWGDEGAVGGTGGVGGPGGGIFNWPSGTLTLVRSAVVGNRAGDGGEGGRTTAGGGRGGLGGEGGAGGGIFNHGTVTLIESTVARNSAGDGGRGGLGRGTSADGGDGGAGGGGGTGGEGAGIATHGLGGGSGTVTIERSTISDNHAGRGGSGGAGADGNDSALGGDGGRGGPGGHGGRGGEGAGIYARVGSVNVVNSTTAGNAAGAGGDGGAGGEGGAALGGGGRQGPGGEGGQGGDGGSGGALYLSNSSAIANATIAHNTSGAGGAGGPGGAGNPTAAAGRPGTIGDAGAILLSTTVTVQNTIFAANGPAALPEGGCSSGFHHATDLGGNVAIASQDCPGLPRDPLLGLLASNGGPTQTMGLRAGSPAIDLVATHCPATDQRGLRRPVGGRCDAGAFEYVPAPQPGGGAPTPSLGAPNAKLKKRRLTLTYVVSGPGTLAVRVLTKKGKRVGRRTVHPTAAGDAKVTIRLAKKAVKAFKARGKLRLRTRAVFTPTGGTPITKTKRLTLRKRAQKSRVQVRGADPGAAAAAAQRMGA